MSIDQYISLGEYCGLHTASSGFLIVLLNMNIIESYEFTYMISVVQGDLVI